MMPLLAALPTLKDAIAAALLKFSLCGGPTSRVSA